jgi:hypothetical protein
MPPSATARLTGDTGQLEAIQTVRFGVDGHAYEIDLPARRASELRSMAGRYIRAARKIQPAPSPAPRQQQRQPRARAQVDREQSRRIRSWARERGLASPRGPIPRHVADQYEATMRAAPVPFRSPGTAEPEPSGGVIGTPPGRRNTPRAAQDEPAANEGIATTGAELRGGEHGLTDREKQELRTIADTAKPQRGIVAGRLRTEGLADRDSAGNWWLTDAGRRELVSA